MIPGSSHNRSSYFTLVFSRPLKGRMWVPRLTTLSHMGQSHVSQPLRSEVMVENVAFAPPISSQIPHGGPGAPACVADQRGRATCQWSKAVNCLIQAISLTLSQNPAVADTLCPFQRCGKQAPVGGGAITALSCFSSRGQWSFLNLRQPSHFLFYLGISEGIKNDLSAFFL